MYKTGNVPENSDYKIVIRPRRRTKDLAGCLELNTVYKVSQEEFDALLFKTKGIDLS